MVDERGAQARTHGAGVTGAIECRYYGRDFTAGEMALLRALIAGPPPLNRHMLSKEFCRRIGWFKPDGGLKDMMARVAMLAMHRDGLIALPAPQGRQNRPGPIVFGPDTEAPLFPAPTTLDKVRPLDLRPVVRGTRESKLWNEFVARYHYLGYKTLVGAQMRYAVHDRDGWPLAMLGFSTAAWKLAPRDNFIGWTRQTREKNLPLVVDNPRFLILPWIRVDNLGSHILAIMRRRLPGDWTRRYNTTPVLIETFVETPRYTGAMYKAANWMHLGRTRGFARANGRYTEPHGVPKELYARALSRDARRRLRGADALPAALAPNPMGGGSGRRPPELRSLYDELMRVPDFRRAQGRKHTSASVLAVHILALLADMHGCLAAAQYAKSLNQTELEALGAWHNPKSGQFVPVSKSTLHRVVANADPAAVEAVLRRYAAPRLQIGQALATDGKRIRGANGDGHFETATIVEHGTGVPFASLNFHDECGEVCQPELPPKAARSLRYGRFSRRCRSRAG